MFIPLSEHRLAETRQANDPPPFSSVFAVRPTQTRPFKPASSTLADVELLSDGVGDGHTVYSIELSLSEIVLIGCSA